MIDWWERFSSLNLKPLRNSNLNSKPKPKIWFSVYSRGSQPCSWRPTILQSSAPFLIKHTLSSWSRCSGLLEKYQTGMLEQGWKWSLQEGSSRGEGLFFDKPTSLTQWGLISYRSQWLSYIGSIIVNILFGFIQVHKIRLVSTVLLNELASDEWHGESDSRVLVIGLCGKFCWEWF